MEHKTYVNKMIANTSKTMTWSMMNRGWEGLLDGSVHHGGRDHFADLVRQALDLARHTDTEVEG